VRQNPRKLRQLRALERLAAQLERGSKPAKRSHPFHNRVEPLSFEDRERIKFEIRRLEQQS
jgi:hypothetical protein